MGVRWYPGCIENEDNSRHKYMERGDGIGWDVVGEGSRTLSIRESKAEPIEQAGPHQHYNGWRGMLSLQPGLIVIGN